MDPGSISPQQRILPLIVSGQATSRAAIARATGLARSTVGEQIDLLLDCAIIETGEEQIPTKGRPAQPLRISRKAGLAAVADVNVGETTLALSSLAGDILQRQVVQISAGQGPGEVLGVIQARFEDMRQAVDPTLQIRYCVVGLPAPVDHHKGCAVRPPLLNGGWDGFPVAATLRESLGAITFVENDVNLMALGEASLGTVDAPLLFIKVAEGIGAGLVLADGSVHRGADGAAGDIGHVTVTPDSSVVCRCGKQGCLEALAGVLALVEDLEGSETNHGPQALMRRLADGDPLALSRLRAAAADIGSVTATLVHMFNPRTLVLGGPLAEVNDQLLSGVRAAVYEQALPLATRKLIITTSQLGSDAGVTGGVRLAMREAFSVAGMRELTGL